MRKLDDGSLARAALVGVGVVFLLLLTCAVAPHVILVAWTILSGPWAYPAAVLPRVHANAGGIVTAGVAALVTLVGTHVTAEWIYRARAGAGAGWKAQWTVAGLAVFVLTFAVAVDVAALVHQTLWLVQAAPKTVVYDMYRDGAFEIHLICRTLDDEKALRAARAQAMNGWDLEVLRRRDGTAGGVAARPRDPRSAFAGTVFTCDGPLSEEAAAAHIERVESETGRQ